MGSQITVLTTLLLGLLSCVHSDYFDSDNVRIDLFYGPTRSDVVSYPLSEAEKVLEDPNFVHTNTVLFIQDYHEPQLKEYRQYILADAYSELQICNYLVLDWGTGFVPLEDIKDPDVDTLVPLVTEFLIRVNEQTDWSQFSVVAYARGTEFIQYVVEDLYQKTFITIPRITQLAPQSYYGQEQTFQELVTDFVDTIHTDIGKHESNFSRAHAEFFPNFGTDPQPGCAADSGNLDICSRQRSMELWAESLYDPIAFCAWSFNAGQIDQKVLMGAACLPSTRGNFYLVTNAESPYGRGCDGTNFATTAVPGQE